jgi:hypoxanthine phosphoribosyltransferase
LLIAENFTSTQNRLGNRILLVDDMADSGKTIMQVIAHLRERHPELEEIRTGVLWQKAHSVFKPDYCVQFLSTDPWIHQPFEIYDNMKMETLLRRAAHRRENLR